MDFTCYSSVLVGRSLLYFLSDGGMILEYDLARHTLISFDIPYSCSTKDVFDCNLMLAENGGLGLVEELNPHLQLWSREVDARWVPSRIIYLGSLSLNGAPVDGACPVHVLGFAEGANVIVVTTSAGVYSIQVQSAHANKVCDEAKECDHYGYGNLIPVVGFYTPVPKLNMPPCSELEAIKILKNIGSIWASGPLLDIDESLGSCLHSSRTQSAHKVDVVLCVFELYGWLRMLLSPDEIRRQEVSNGQEAKIDI
ncbi:hypothetical protein ZWY2020_030241 [Hordeum vulgare]|nr:hypothetical protein ZWY2020_030241 [Hordeum vulgare]